MKGYALTRIHFAHNHYPIKVMNDSQKDIEYIMKRLDGLEHTVFGNGQKGLKAELIELKAEIETFKKIAVWQIGILIAILCAVLKIIF